ncbi:hypothetical protein [Dishui Lake phycodnavirus 3]|nr:hypothetical protein [Dishui Lake phycodnavirus 3]
MEGHSESDHWTQKHVDLLSSWAERAAGYRWLHNHARLHFKRQNDYLSYPSIIIASITGVGGFAVLNPSGNEDLSPDTRTKIMIVQYLFAFLNVLGGILTSISKFSQSSSLAEAHSAMCIQYSKFYRNIQMELSLDTRDRTCVVEFVKKCREEYDRLLDDAPDIPAISIQAFNIEFPDRVNKPDVCNGLSIIVSDETSSQVASTRTLARWLGALKSVTRRSRDIDDLARMESV